MRNLCMNLHEDFSQGQMVHMAQGVRGRREIG